MKRSIKNRIATALIMSALAPFVSKALKKVGL